MFGNFKIVFQMMESLCMPSEITWECDPSLNRKFTNISCAPVILSPKTVLHSILSGFSL